jgi:hypothetical protein
METARSGLVRIFAGMATLALCATFLIGFLNFSTQAMIGGMLIGGISGIILCFLLTINWSPAELKMKRDKEGLEVLGMIIMAAIGGFIAPYFYARSVPSAEGVNFISLGFMAFVLFTYMSVQIWLNRPRS